MDTYVEKLSKVTFSVHHNPNCPRPFQVRLIGKFTGQLDNLSNKDSKDVIGCGETFAEAAKEAWIKRHGKL